MMNSAISSILFKSRTGISISSLGARSVAKAIMPGTFGNKYGLPRLGLCISIFGSGSCLNPSTKTKSSSSNDKCGRSSSRTGSRFFPETHGPVPSALLRLPAFHMLLLYVTCSYLFPVDQYQTRGVHV